MTKKNIPAAGLSLLLLALCSWGAYDSITPLQLHERLINGDTLIVLDVREWANEYTVSHIAEPAGQLPLTVASMPWTSGVLRANFAKLPRNVDIVVHCAGGGRSKDASAFLADTMGFTRIFNMLGGFYAWSYEKRSGGFGDGSGAWVRPLSAQTTSIARDSAALSLYPGAFSGMDSLYCEVHFASGKQPIPADAPLSGVDGLFRITAVDKFGLSLFRGDSLGLRDTVTLTFSPHSKTGAALPGLTDCRLTALAGPGIWRPLAFDYRPKIFHRGETVLRQWYSAQASLSAEIVRLPDASPVKTNGRALPSGPRYDLRGCRSSTPSPLTPSISLTAPRSRNQSAARSPLSFGSGR